MFGGLTLSYIGSGLGCAPPCVDDGVGQKNNCAAQDAASASESSQGSTVSATEPTGVTMSASAESLTDDASASADASSGPTADATSADDTNTSDDSSGTTGDPDLGHFGVGSLIIPMDTDYQDSGMLEAYGLVYELLTNEITIAWTILPGKGFGEVDFTTTATDLRSGDVVPEHGYRGGPFVVRESDAVLALPIVEAWLAANPDTAVHEVTADFDAHIARRLLHAPTIAVFVDGNEDVARNYLVAAKIPDSTGDMGWPNNSPDLLDIDEIAGPSEALHDDGALFTAGHNPRYCQLMSMHWDVSEAEANPEVVAEVRSYLQFSTHFFAECQAVNAFENLEPYGFFLTPNGLDIDERPAMFDFFRMDTPFGQIDGLFGSVGGSEPSYSLPPGDAYYQNDTVLITASGSPEGTQDVWMTGFLDGACPATEDVCEGAGKVSYLGGHQYNVAMPISQHPDSQGARLFLNSLFEAPCVLVE